MRFARFKSIGRTNGSACHSLRRLSPTFESLERRALMSADIMTSAAPILSVAPTAVHFTSTHHAPARLAAPSSLTAAQRGDGTVELNWSDNDLAAAGYYVLRATGAGRFKRIAKLSSALADRYVDNTARQGKTYNYELQAYRGRRTSPFSIKAVPTPYPVPTPGPAPAPSLLAPSGLTATIAGTAVDLTWTDNDPAATGYIVLRSMDAVNYDQIAQITSATAASYIDTSGAGGAMYYYEVQASNGGTTSNESAAVAVSVPNTVSVTTRFGNELVITSTGASDTVEVDQNGPTLMIVGNAQTFTAPIPAAAVFVYARGVNDLITIDPTVTVRTTIDTIRDGYQVRVHDHVVDRDRIISYATDVSAWINAADSFDGRGTVHLIGSFLGGISKALADSLPNPSDSGNAMSVDLSLWGTGPVADDVNQGAVGDCYFVSSLAAFARTRPSTLQESAVDLGDGTFAVQFYQGGTPVFVRVSNNLPTGGFGGYEFAHPGPNGTIWAAVIEKAFAYFRDGSNTYMSLTNGWMSEVYSDLGLGSTDYNPGSLDESSFYSMVANALASGEPVTFGTFNAPPDLVGHHSYTLMGIVPGVVGAGPTTYLVRNPWGVSGDSMEDPSGYAYLTFAQVTANFSDVCIATG